MITINLLPPDLRPVKRTPVPYILSAFLVAGAVLSCYNVWAGNNAKNSEIDDELTRNNLELESLKESVEKYNQLSEEKKSLASQLDTINEIASDRIIWSQSLYDLSRLALSNMWYSDIEVDTRVTTNTVETIDPKTKKVKKEKVKVTQHILTLEGFISPDSDGRVSLGPFTSAAEADPEFSSMFELVSWDFDDTEFGTTVVKKFLLEYLITHGGTK